MRYAIDEQRRRRVIFTLTRRAGEDVGDFSCGPLDSIRNGYGQFARALKMAKVLSGKNPFPEQDASGRDCLRGQEHSASHRAWP
jgi:hypothetical protein